jgi:hypothetical protein
MSLDSGESTVAGAGRETVAEAIIAAAITGPELLKTGSAYTLDSPEGVIAGVSLASFGSKLAP